MASSKDVPAKKMSGGNYPAKNTFKESKLPSSTTANMYGSGKKKK